MTPDEAHRAVARQALGPTALLRGYGGDLAGAARDVAVGSWGRVGDVEWEITGGRVTYTVGNVEGTTTVRDLVRVGVAAATRGAVDRLSGAVDRQHRAHRGAALLAELTDAEAGVRVALAAWWDGPAGQQLDLFGAAS